MEASFPPARNPYPYPHPSLSLQSSPKSPKRDSEETKVSTSGLDADGGLKKLKDEVEAPDEIDSIDSDGYEDTHQSDCIREQGQANRLFSNENNDIQELAAQAARTRRKRFRDASSKGSQYDEDVLIDDDDDDSYDEDEEERESKEKGKGKEVETPPEEEVDKDEMRRRRLARFGGGGG